MATAVLLGSARAAQARLVRVGGGGDYTTLEAAINGHTYGAGDTIAVFPGRYDVTQMLQPLGSGAAGSTIVVRGTGTTPSVISGTALTNSKALWDLEHSNRWWVFENLAIQDMRGAQTNARGFFLVGCSDIVIQHCEVSNCWNGFMTASGSARVTIQFCNIHDNGGLVGPAHNLYLNSGSDIVVQHNWIHDAHYGTNFKDRTQNLKLLYNWIENANLGGYEISLAGAGSADLGEALLVGNVIVKSATSAQQTHCVRFEDYRVGTLKLVNNTVVARANNVVVYSIASTTALHNNIFVGGKTLFASDSPLRVLTGSNNWVSSSLPVPGGLSGTLSSTDPGLVDQSAGDLHLSSGSPCVDAGNGSLSPLPEWQYAATASRESRTVSGAAIDIGAFERAGTGSPGSASDTTPPAAPSNLTATAAGSSQIDLAWTAPADSDVAGYRIYRALSPSASFDSIATTTATAFSNTGLGDSTTYYYQVRAVDGSGNLSDPSDTASATTATQEGATMEVTVLVGTLAEGDGSDLEEDDAADLVVDSALQAGKHYADWYVTADVGVGVTSLRVTYNGAASAATTQWLYLWRWPNRRWHQIDQASVGVLDQTRAKLVRVAAPFVSPDGQVCLRVVERGKTGSAFRCLADQALFEIVAQRSAAPAPPAKADGVLPLAPGSTPASLVLLQGTALAGDVASLAADDNNCYVVQAAGSGGKQAGKQKKQFTDWYVNAPVPDTTVGLRVTLLGSSSVRSKQTLYLWRWKSSRWKPILNTHPGLTEMTCVRTLDTATAFVAPGGLVRLRVLTEAKGSFTSCTDLVLFEAVAPDSAAARAVEPAMPAAGGPASLGIAGGSALQQSEVRFVVRGATNGGVTLYDVRGRRIVRVDNWMAAGDGRLYIWDGHDARGALVPRGVYFARVPLPDGDARTCRVVWMRE